MPDVVILLAVFHTCHWPHYVSYIICHHICG